MKRWFRAYWAEDDVWFYFEFNPEGWVTRQVELEGPQQTPVAAASHAESDEAEQVGALAEYEATLGFTATILLSEWDGYEPHELTADAFETVWAAARAACRAGSRKRSTKRP